MNLLQKLLKHFKKEEHSYVSTIASNSYLYGNYIERVLEEKFKEDVKKLNQRSAQSLRYKVLEMIQGGIPLNSYKIKIEWKPTVHLIPKTYLNNLNKK